MFRLKNRKAIMTTLTRRSEGFTIVELLSVIVVIAILATITIVAYNGIQKRANETKMKTDIATIGKAITVARVFKQSTLHDITGTWFTAYSCAIKPSGTNLATLSRTDRCWEDYISALASISEASGMNIENMIDPWGRPYIIDENEGEGDCSLDMVAAYPVPFNGILPVYSGGSYPGVKLRVGVDTVSEC